MPIRAEPAFDMTDFTSAKSRLIRPGVVIRSVMPETPCISTWSACLKASRIATWWSVISSNLSLGDGDQGVDLFAQRLDTGLGLVRPTLALEGERAGHHTDRQRAQCPRDPGHHRSAAGTGAAALTGGHEHHVGTLEDVLDLVGVIVGGLAALLRIGAGAQPSGFLAADVELDIGIAHQQGLGIGVHRNELHAAQAGLDHPIDGVDTATTHANYFDDCEVVLDGLTTGPASFSCEVTTFGQA